MEDVFDFDLIYLFCLLCFAFFLLSALLWSELFFGIGGVDDQWGSLYTHFVVRGCFCRLTLLSGLLELFLWLLFFDYFFWLLFFGYVSLVVSSVMFGCGAIIYNIVPLTCLIGCYGT